MAHRTWQTTLRHIACEERRCFVLGCSQFVTDVFQLIVDERPAPSVAHKTNDQTR